MPVNTNIISTILGMKVRQARKKQGLTLSEFAEVCELSPSYLTEIESGLKYPKPDKIVRLAEVLNISYDQLVSIQLDSSQADLATFLSSPVLQEFPFELFGVASTDVIKLITQAPARASALIHAVVEIARQYDIRMEHLLRAALRSYQEMNHNYFEEIEEAAENYSVQHRQLDEIPPSLANLRDLVTKQLNYEVDEITLRDYPELASYRSVFLPGSTPRLLINPQLHDVQKKFLLARELGYSVLGLSERARTSAPDTHDSFQQILNDFKASYFSGALLMPRARLLKDLKSFFSLRKWHTGKLEGFLKRYEVTPEMLLYRFTELIPSHFGVELHFLRFQGGNGGFQVTKQFNISQLLIPSRLGLNEHYCRRWLSVVLLRMVESRKVQGGPYPVVGAQRSQVVDSGERFLYLGFGRPLTLASDISSSVTLGFKLDPELASVIRFAEDPAIPNEIVGETCERCPLSPADCAVRATPPSILQQQKAHRRRQEQLRALRQQLQPTG